jgi:transcriptional regulator with XRE-family HTH domain
MATVGERIKEVREAKGWTQERLATESDVSKSFLSEVEKHGKNISLDLLLKVATALGASVGYLASGEGAQPGERKPVVIPVELSEVAEELHLSYPETLDLLEAYGSVIARRSNRHKGTMTVDDWKSLHKALSNVVKKVYG